MENKLEVTMKTKDEIIDLIEEEGVEFIRLQFTDIFGNLKNLAVTPSQMERVLNNRYSFEAADVFGNAFDPEEDLYLYPDLDTFVILPWRPQQGKVGKILCDVRLADGKDFEMDSRAILKNVLKKAADMGYTFYVDPECEFFLFHTDENGNPTNQTHEKAGYMDVGPIDFGENARRDMVLTLEEMGFEVESSHHEKAPAQHEIDFKEAEALQIADSITTFKFAVRSIAKRFGLYATFMPKPKTDYAGSGMHLNVSLYKDDKNVFRDSGAEDNISETAKYFMGGIMAHARALCAITNPIVNSYKRILTGFEAPSDITWTTRGENALLKVKNSFDDMKVELRFPDASANPYLALAVCLAAGIDGIEQKINPGENSAGIKKPTNAVKLPDNLKEAVVAMKNDAFMEQILGKQFVQSYTDYKLKEWNDYMMQVSDWEVNKYLYRM